MQKRGEKEKIDRLEKTEGLANMKGTTATMISTTVTMIAIVTKKAYCNINTNCSKGCAQKYIQLTRGQQGTESKTQTQLQSPADQG